MICPVCEHPILPIDCGIYKDRPSYSCANYTQEEHYKKYFSAGWSYTHYIETATFKGYQIVNTYNYREGKSDFGIIKKYMTTLNIIGNEQKSYNSILRIPRIIPIPTMEKFLYKVKTLLVMA